MAQWQNLTSLDMLGSMHDDQNSCLTFQLPYTIMGRLKSTKLDYFQFLYTSIEVDARQIDNKKKEVLQNLL
jgi:hypothetical protein